MKLRDFYLILATGVITLLLIAGASFYGILAQSPLALLTGGVEEQPTATMFVSRQAPIMTSLLVNPDRLEAFRQLAAAPGARRKARQEIRDVERSLLATTGLDYHRDIQPWIGDEITLAVTSLDYDRDRENGVQPGYLLVLTTKKGELAREFLQSFYSQQAISGNYDLTFEQYKGVNLVFQRPRKSKTKIRLAASAIVGDFVLFANQPKVLKDAITSAQATELNLATSASYQTSLENISVPHIGMTFINLPAVSAWIGNQPVPETPDIEQLLTIAETIAPEGLAAHTALIGVVGENNQLPDLSEPVEALKYIPAHSAIAAAGSNLNHFWSNITTGLAIDSPLQQLLKQFIARLQAPLGIDFTTAIFPWVKGEYALSFVANPKTGEFDWVFVAEKVDRQQAEMAIDELDTIATQQGLSTGILSIEEQQATAWTKLSTSTEKNLVSLNARVSGSHTSVGKYEIFATSVEALSQALGTDNLLLSDRFQQAIAALPTANDGYFYIDWHQSEPLVQQKLPLTKIVQLALEPLFNHLKDITISSEGSTNGVRRGNIFLHLG